MAVHTIRCQKCDEARDMLYQISGPSPASMASKAVCHVCGHQGMKIDFSVCVLGAPVIKFRDGFYNVGTSNKKRGKYYSTQREMINDAARKGINVVRG